MMRCATVFLALAATILIASGVASAAPPARPLQLTGAQFDRLCQLESQPVHAAILDVRASYTSEREARLESTRLANDVATGAWQFGFPGAILFMLIAAAPL